MKVDDFPSSREQLVDSNIQQNGQIVKLMGALGDLVDAVEGRRNLDAALEHAKSVLGRNRP